MDFTLGPDGSWTISPDYEFLAGAFLRLGGMRTAADRFRLIRGFMKSDRPKFSIAARDYFRTKGYQSLGEAALLINESSIFPSLLRIGPGDKYIEFEDTAHNVVFKGAKLPTGSETFIDNIVRHLHDNHWDKSPFHREGEDLVYRLKAFNQDGENPKFTFNKCIYRDYVNTCEYHAHSIVDSFVSVSTWRANRKVEAGYIKGGVVSNPFSFDQLNCSVGINTLLVLADEIKPLFILHNRSKTNVAEAQGLRHVVPAGTFQPIHRENSFHEQDFSIYANIIREFAEELLGDSDVTHPVGYRENIYERESIRRIHHLMNIGRGAVYLAGFGVDALTAKPEFLTVMVLVKKDLDEFFSSDFVKFAQANKEGMVDQFEFTIENLTRWRDSPAMLAAGAGCLQVGINNFEVLRHFGSS